MDALSVRLREGTKEAHTLAERVDFIRCFLRGVVDVGSYRLLVANLYFVYAAMEEVLDETSAVASLDFPELRRRASLEADVAFFWGSSWQRSIAPSAATERYVARIRESARARPELLAGHLYTRYLGDLSGGQVLAKIAAKALGISDGRGLAFYRFDGIEDPKAFKTAYRAALDALCSDAATVDAIVAEANASFRHNMEIFSELEGTLREAIGRALWDSVTRRSGVAVVA